MKTFKNSTQPGAWIVNPHDRGRKAIKGEKNIYLNPNQEFAIELYNPLSRCILANIKLNGDLISTKGLVLRPGERSYLDCFIDDQRKFIFTTYSVENTNLNQEAIQNNGSIEIFFYEEEHLYIWQTEIYPVFNTYWYKSYFNTSNPWPNPWYGTSNPTYTTTDYNGYSSISYSSNNLNPQNLTCSNSTIETGRVERGTKSEQQFQDVIKNFSNYLLHSVSYQLLPQSQEPHVIKEVKKPHNWKDVLIQLSELKELGILTAEEYERKKNEILTRI